MQEKARIYIVEDDEETAAMITVALEGCGYAVVGLATKADRAVDEILAMKPDVVIMDIMLKGKNDGIIAARKIMASWPVPIIYLTAYSDEDLITRAKITEPYGYIIKPFENRELFAAIEIALYKRRIEDKLRESEACFRNVFEHAVIGMALLDVDGHFLQANIGFADMLGYGVKELLKLKLQSLTDSHDLMIEMGYIRQLLAGESHAFTLEKRFRHKNQDQVWALVSMSLIRDSRGQPLYFILQAQDITQQKSTEVDLKHLAEHDVLTHMPNQTIIEDCINQLLIVARNRQQHIAIMLVGLDRFSSVSQTYGETAALALVQGVADRLRVNLRNNDTVSALGQDQFLVILDDIVNDDFVAKVAEQIRQALAKPLLIENKEVFITSSIGISLFPKDGDDTHSLLRNADVAMHRARQRGGNNYYFCTSDISVLVQKRSNLETDLRRALEQHEFLLYYQPKISLLTGKITGVEALLRWQVPGQGMISPLEFIPLAEQTGLIIPMGEWVLQEACRQNKLWQTMGLAPIMVSVNVSARQLEQNSLSHTVQRALQETDLDARFLDLDLTETAVMKIDKKLLGVMQSFGYTEITLSLDDYGVEYSSLNHMTGFPINNIKIDLSALSGIPTDANDVVVARTIITMAHSFGNKVIAVGVQTKEQVDFLRLHHCDEVQGYYCSLPLPAKEMTALLTSGWKMDFDV